MDIQGRRESSNVEDRRGTTTGRKIVFGGGAVGILFLVAQYFMGVPPTQILQQAVQQINVTQGSDPNAKVSTQDDEMAKVIKVSLAETEDVWRDIFRQYNLGEYREPTLVLFRGSTQSGCGGAESAMGPFYCPADEKVYVDLSFFDELKNQYGAEGGDFAISYVLAHEIGHHVQNLLGTSGKISQLEKQTTKTNANKLSVGLELQADFYAGVWANHDKNLKIDNKDIEEALSAASAVGDDEIQQKAQGYVVPESFTHGSAKQRIYWFKKGFQTGDIQQGNTFKELGLTQ